ncbi:MAG: PQQ-binding-like beta-propeller repeat protein [Gemmatimonadales bacterium]|nr:PQQ-binding-like beta-propeller repeat protein [Gemmatimonadales bacterium]
MTEMSRISCSATAAPADEVRPRSGQTYKYKRAGAGAPPPGAAPSQARTDFYGIGLCLGDCPLGPRLWRRATDRRGDGGGEARRGRQRDAARDGRHPRLALLRPGLHQPPVLPALPDQHRQRQELRQAWKYNTGLPSSFENSPIVVGNTMYISTPLNQVVALDARTGQRQWQYVHEHNTTVHCCGAVNRGVAVYDDRVYMGALDPRLIALDAASGKKLWDVQVADNERGYALNGPVVAIDGKVITGVSGAEYGIRGFIAAHDARTGKEVWRWYVVQPRGGRLVGPVARERRLRRVAQPEHRARESRQREVCRCVADRRWIRVAGTGDRHGARIGDLHRRQPFARSRRQRAAGRQPVDQRDHRARLPDRRVPLGVPADSPRRLGPRHRESGRAGGSGLGRAADSRRGPGRQARLGGHRPP